MDFTPFPNNDQFYVQIILTREDVDTSKLEQGKEKHCCDETIPMPTVMCAQIM